MKLQLIIMFIFFTIGLSAQTYVDIPWRDGTVTIAGKEEQGIIRLGGDLGAPWLNHTKVYFVPKADCPADKKPTKKVIKEYAPDDIQGYSTSTEDKDGKYIRMKFVTRQVLVEKGLSKKLTNVFLHQLEDGAVTVLSFTPTPDSEETLEQANNQTIMYLQKGTNDVVPAVDVELANLLSECPKVVMNVQNKTYGFADLSERPQRKGLGKVMADNIGNNDLENKIRLAVSDYNNCMR